MYLLYENVILLIIKQEIDWSQLATDFSDESFIAEIHQVFHQLHLMDLNNSTYLNKNNFWYILVTMIDLKKK